KRLTVLKGGSDLLRAKWLIITLRPTTSRAAQRKYQQTYIARVRKEAQARLLMSKDAWNIPPFLVANSSTDTYPARDSLPMGALRDSHSTTSAAETS
ncbi:hypothetical protein, partial [Burkholderia stagnalis]|uniref:hypothetical protein n=1 Tax=Burkholderia stagnalis TaxID=1503054 RepID=UPI001C88F459